MEITPLRALLWIIGGGFAVAGATLIWYANNAPPTPITSEPAIVTSKPRHPVTPEMWKRADAAKGVLAPDFTAPTVDGKQIHLRAYAAGRPAVVYFIKYDCPCSNDADPLYRRVYAAFDAKVPFVGVINTDKALTKKWLARHKPQYPVVMDPKLKIIQSYKVSQSAYLALLDGDGRIERLWPGYSQQMLRELHEAISRLTKREGKPLDVAYAPKEISSGCSFYEPSGS
jgi:peroxiredoxin